MSQVQPTNINRELSRKQKQKAEAEATLFIVTNIFNGSQH